MTRNVFPKVKAVDHSYSLMIDFDLEIVKATEYCYRPLQGKELMELPLFTPYASLLVTNLVPCTFECGKLLQDRLMGKLEAKD